jgi:hypothetical protein
MSIEVTLVPELTPTVTAASDLSAHKNKFVQVHGTGVVLADVRSQTFTKTYVLQNQPLSGEPCTVSGGPNVAKVIAGEAITRGAIVQCMSASGLAGIVPVTSGGWLAPLGTVGTAWSTVAGSGEYLAVKLNA